MASSSSTSTQEERDKPSFVVSMLQLMALMLLRFPIPLRVWIWSLLSVNTLGPMLFWESLEAKVTIAVFLPSALIMTIMYQRFGLVRLLGLGHALWPALLIWLCFWRLPNMPDGNEGLKTWLMALVLLDSISVIWDTIDVYKYVVLGQRNPTMVWEDTKKNQ